MNSQQREQELLSLLALKEVGLDVLHEEKKFFKKEEEIPAYMKETFDLLAAETGTDREMDYCPERYQEDLLTHLRFFE